MSVIALDFDSTLVEPGAPLRLKPHAREAILSLLEAGHTLVLHSARSAEAHIPEGASPEQTARFREIQLIRRREMIRFLEGQRLDDAGPNCPGCPVDFPGKIPDPKLRLPSDHPDLYADRHTLACPDCRGTGNASGLNRSLLEAFEDVWNSPGKPPHVDLFIDDRARQFHNWQDVANDYGE